MNFVLVIVALAASVLGSGMAFPQAIRLKRHGSTDGVSAIWIGVSLAINGWWTAYAFAVSLWALLPVSMVSFALYGWIAVVYTRSVGRRAAPGMLIGLFGLGMVPLPVVLVHGWGVAGVAIGLCYGVQLAPAVVAAFRTHDLAGISPGTWIISLGEALLWLAYGVGVADRALVAGGASGVVMAGAIVARLAFTGFLPSLRGVRRPRSIA